MATINLGSPSTPASSSDLAALRTAMGLGNVSNTADADKPVSTAQAAAIAAVAGPGAVPLSANRVLAASDDGATFRCSAALTITVPAGLTPRPTFIVDVPPTGAVTIASSGGALLNGATASFTRTRANNPAGFAVVAHGDADSYGVGGA